MERAERFLRRFGSLTVALLSAAIIWWVWDQQRPVAVIHDEASYLLQADIFASGRWTMPTPALPEFHEQPHVQLVPAMASKYPPGHALLLSGGARLGWPALVPLLLTAVTAALLFAIGTRIANPWVGLFACVVWIFAPVVLRFQPSYLSELTTTPLVLGSWLTLDHWRADRRRGWLLLLAFLIGWGAITRPLTMFVFAIPIAVVVLHQVRQDGRWRDLGTAIALGIAVLSVLPLWSQKTTGDWRVSPLEKYRLDYLPFDKMGFGTDTTPPRRFSTMSPVLRETYDFFLTARRTQSVGTLPGTAWQRARALAAGFFEGGRLPLIALAAVGLVVMPRIVGLAVLSCALLFLAHLPYAHLPGWTVYYLETIPVAALVTALGLGHIATRYARSRAASVLATAAAGVVLVGAFGAHHWREEHRGPEGGQLHRQLATIVRTLPQPGILFVRYSPRIMHNPAIVQNHADPASVGIWIVHDLGARNDELLRRAPGRVSHYLDVDRMVRGAPAR